MRKDRQDTNPEELPPKSKSQLKREMTALQKLGEKLVNLAPAILSKAPLSDELRDEVEQVRRITHHEGRRRQLQYLGKVMRRVETEEIEQFLQEIESGNRRASQEHHKLESLRDRLIEEGDAVLQELLEEYPGADLQHIRQLVRTAKKEALKNAPPAASRKLFKYLRELTQE
jgi:ribosome-associated protein